jgi:hypothetical protein
MPMKRTMLLILGTLLGALSLFATISMADKSESPRVLVCHIPPDNPTNVYTISVPGKAVSAHLQHGDILGECPTACIDPTLCDDGDVCTIDDCDNPVGCAYFKIECNDFNACTDDSYDFAEGCQYSEISCDDGNDCTEDSCHPNSGCAHDPIC